MVRMAMGSDTGGSIRGPAAWCGTVGIKPTYGRVSRRGVFPLSWTLDHFGPLTRSVEDSAITLQVLAGHDPQDPASADVPVPDYRADLEKGVAGLRIGIPRAFFATAPATTQEVVAGIDRTAAQLRAAGAVVEDIELPDYALFSAVGRVIMMAEAFAIHEADMQTRLLDYGEITAGRFVLGAAITAADFIHALRARRELTDAVNAALTRYDALLTPSALSTAPRFDQPTDALSSASPIQTIPFNVTGHPAMSVPIGLGADGLPIGVQIVGRAFDEPMVFRDRSRGGAAVRLGERSSCQEADRRGLRQEATWRAQAPSGSASRAGATRPGAACSIPRACSRSANWNTPPASSVRWRSTARSTACSGPRHSPTGQTGRRTISCSQ